MRRESKRALLSVVMPARNESKNLGLTVSELITEFDAAGIPFEIVVVNDGGDPATQEVAEGLRAMRPEVRVVPGARISGFGRTVRAGLDQVRGRRRGHRDGGPLRRSARRGALLPEDRRGLRLRLRLPLPQGKSRLELSDREARREPYREHGDPAALLDALQRSHERVQGLSPGGDPRVRPLLVQPLQPDHRDVALRTDPELPYRRDSDRLDRAHLGRVEPEHLADGTPLPERAPEALLREDPDRGRPPRGAPRPPPAAARIATPSSRRGSPRWSRRSPSNDER